MSESAYVPGVCNINPAEIAYRRKARDIGFIVAIAVFVALLFVPIHPIIRGSIVFFPLFVGMIGYYQVKNRFCVGYGAAGKQNADGNDMVASSVESDEAARKDKAKARSMNLRAALVSAGIAVVTMLLPSL